MADYAQLHAPIIPIIQTLLQDVTLRPHAVALDLACGTGEKLPLLQELLPARAQVIMLDWDVTALRTLRDQPPISTATPHALAADAHRLPLRESCANLIVCIAAIGLFQDQLVALREMRRVLAPGGRVLVLTAERRWARVTNWPTMLADFLAALPQAHADHAEDRAMIAYTAGFKTAASFAFLLDAAKAPHAAALALAGWQAVAPLAHLLSPDLLADSQQAAASADIELCDVCLASWLA